MRKELIYLFVILISLVFIISGCEQTVGTRIGEEESIVNVISNHVEVKEGENANNMYMNEKDGMIYYKSIPIFSFNLESRENNNIQANNINYKLATKNLGNIKEKNKITGDVIYRWADANTNHGLNDEEEYVLDRNRNLLSRRFYFDNGFEEDIPLIRNGRVVYPNGRYFISEFMGVTDEMLEEMPAAERAHTLRFRTYYVNDLMPALRVNDIEGDQRVINYFTEKLGEWRNDMDYSIRFTTLAKNYMTRLENDEEFYKWFIVYIQYFDENGRPITELPKAISLATISESILLENSDSIGAYGYGGLIGSRWEGDNLIIRSGGFQWGDFENTGNGWFRLHLPLFEGIRQISRTTPARRLER